MNIRIISLLVILTILFSCKKKEADKSKEAYGKLQICASAITQNLTKSASEENISYVVVSINDDQGKSVYSLEKIPLYKFNENYISEPISLFPGDYQLIEFLLIDETGSVLYVCPIESSDKAYLVNDPLPIDFTITKDNVTKIETEVLSAIGCTREDFGYSTFGFNIVETLDFLLGVFVYNETSQNFELTSANVTIESGIEELFNQEIYPLTNTITIRDNYPEYTMTIEKAGYQFYQYTFSNDSLKSHSNDPLEIIL